jgi:hypothetical protein
MASRDEFSGDVIRRLGESVNLHCSNCDAPTKGGHSLEGKAISLGVACHIHAAAPGGPRYDASQTEDERRSFDNGIWLCANCARLIDSDVPRFSADVLRSWKRGALRLAAERIGRPPIVVPTPTQGEEHGPIRAMVLHLEVLREHAYEINVSNSWQRVTPTYDLTRVDDLLPQVPTVLEDHSRKESMRLIHYWAARPAEGDAARMIFSESERLLSWLRTRVGART